MKKILLLSACFFLTLISFKTIAKEYIGFGLNDKGQVATSPIPIPYYNAKLPSDLADKISYKEDLFACGESHTVAVHEEPLPSIRDGKIIYVWGSNKYGQLSEESGIPIGGNATNYEDIDFGDPNKPYAFADNEVIIKVSCGRYHTAVLTNFGRLFVWGLNTSGQVGSGSSEPIVSAITEITTGVFSLPFNTPYNVYDMKFKDVACGGYHTLAARDNPGNSNEIYSWGDNSYGQLGRPNLYGNLQNSPANVLCRIYPYPYNYTGLGYDEFHTIACGDYFSIVAFKGDEDNPTQAYYFAAGDNTYGQLGYQAGQFNETEYSFEYVSSVSGLFTYGTTLKKIACGYEHVFFVFNNNEVWGWGRNDKGQLGNGSVTNERTFASRIVSLDNFSDIACGYHSSIGIKNSEIYRWGRLSPTTFYNLPNQLGADGEYTDAKNVYAGGFHNFVVCDNISKPIFNPINSCNSSSLSLSWNSINGAVRYIIEVYTDPAYLNHFNTYSVINNTAGNTLNLLLVPGNIYYLRAYTMGSASMSAPSYLSINVSPNVPVISSITPTNGALNVNVAPTLNWTLNYTYGAVACSLIVSTNPDLSNPLISIAQTVNNSTTMNTNPSSFNIPTGILNDATKYYWGFKSIGASGCESFTTVGEFTTKLAPPTIISPVCNSQITGLNANLSWNCSTTSPNTRYNLVVSTSPNYESGTIVLNLTNLNATTYNLANLLYGKTYYWKVKAIDNDMVSDYTTCSFATEKINLSGVAIYKNSSNRPLNPYFKIELRDINNNIYKENFVLNTNGEYELRDVPPGEYRISFKYSIPPYWGGLDTLDYILAYDYVYNNGTLNDIQLAAADANQNGRVDANDLPILLDKMNNVYNPNWLIANFVSTPIVTITGTSTNVILNLEVLAGGDLDGSFY